MVKECGLLHHHDVAHVTIEGTFIQQSRNALTLLFNKLAVPESRVVFFQEVNESTQGLAQLCLRFTV